MNSDGTNQDLASSPLAGALPAWSPAAGMLIAFSKRNGPPTAEYDIAVIGSTEHGERRLTTGVDSDLAAAWSPDGTEIAFGHAGAGDLGRQRGWKRPPSSDDGFLRHEPGMVAKQARKIAAATGRSTAAARTGSSTPSTSTPPPPHLHHHLHRTATSTSHLHRLRRLHLCRLRHHHRRTAPPPPPPPPPRTLRRPPSPRPAPGAREELVSARARCSVGRVRRTRSRRVGRVVRQSPRPRLGQAARLPGQPGRGPALALALGFGAYRPRLGLMIRRNVRLVRGHTHRASTDDFYPPRRSGLELAPLLPAESRSLRVPFQGDGLEAPACPPGSDGTRRHRHARCSRRSRKGRWRGLRDLRRECRRKRTDAPDEQHVLGLASRVVARRHEDRVQPQRSKHLRDESLTGATLIP